MPLCKQIAKIRSRDYHEWTQTSVTLKVFLYTQGRYKSLFFKTSETPVLEYADETSVLPVIAEFIVSYSIIYR